MKQSLLRIFAAGIAVAISTAVAGAIPNSPTGLRVSGETITSVSLAWDSSPNTCWYANQTNCVIGYCAYYNTSMFVSKSNFIPPQLCGSGTTQTFYALTQGRMYYFVATAFDNTGAEGWESSTVAGVPGKPAPPTGLMVTEAKNGHVSLAWNASPDPNILGYSLSWLDDQDNYLGSVFVYGTAHTVYGLTNGLEYGFEVEAIDRFYYYSDAATLNQPARPLSHGGVPQWPVPASDPTYNWVNATFGEVHPTDGNHLHALPI